jgi:LPXTG-site transpeptidase (sortase) family protein
MMNISKKHSKKRAVTFIVALFLVAAFIISGYFLASYFLTDYQTSKQFQQTISDEGISIEPIPEKERDSYTVPADYPRYIYIPSINVNKARIIAVGVKKPNVSGQQQMDVPKNINDAGWYNCQINPVVEKRCSQPTLPGSGDTDTAAIMAGHTCFSNTRSCVFDNISKLKAGEIITIELGDGSKINYAVKRVDILKLADVDMAKAMRPIEPDKEGLTLITCTGKYKGATDVNGVRTADHRVLVYALRTE